ncbi:IclR family transcriptional regulator domain-containing protein, partial [Actinokineospora sp. 24-640]
AAFLTTAVGRLVLAERPDLAARVRSRPLTALTPYTITSWPQLSATLDAVRDTGIAVEHNQMTLGYSCIAVGVRGDDDTLVGFLCVIGRNSSFAPHRIARPLLNAASDVSRLLATDR